MATPVLFARQPVFDATLNTYAYQLLYRDSQGEGPTSEFDGVAATTEVLVNAYSNILERGQVKYLPALVNFNAEWLYDGQLPAVPVETLILDVERDDELTDFVLEQLQNLASEGYRLSVSYQAEQALLDIAAIIKVDVQATQASELEALCQRFKHMNNKTLLAEKVENYAEFEQCKQAGFDLFLGYFFARPQFIKGRKLSRNELVMLQLIGEVHHPDATPESIETLIQKDPQLVAGLLRLVNSAVFRGQRTIGSIAEAIVVLGLKELRKWVLLLALSRNQSQSSELLTGLLVKGKMCQLLAEVHPQVDASTAFMTGLLSGIDALLGVPQDEILEQLPVQVEVKRALCGGKNPLGLLLSSVHQHNRGDWQTLDQDEAQYTKAYAQAVLWSNETLKSLS